MKKLLVVIAIITSIAIVVSLNANNGKFNVEEKDPSKMQVSRDGSITIDNVKFKNMSAYFKSEHFKGTNKKCKDISPKSIMFNNLSSTFKKPGGNNNGDCTSSCTVIKSQYDPGAVYTIPVVFHVIMNTNGAGALTDERIQRQIDVLNADYSYMNIQFELAPNGITRTTNNSWFNDSGERKYKRSLKWDTKNYLNIYTNTASGYLGYAYFAQTSAGSVLDGVVLNYEACGGRNEGSAPYNQGRTLVHEIGHYLGLYHTFQSGCGTGYCAGDLIEDTNPESSPFYGCNENRTTCGSPDPTENFMDYTEDACMDTFTAEQVNRARCGLMTYRSQLYY